MQEMWSYQTDVYPDTNSVGSLVGYKVEALDGSIGKVDEATNESDRNYLVVDTGPWIFGKQVLLPAGVVSSVDAAETTIHINRSRDQVKDSPEFKTDNSKDSGYQDQIGSYYGAEGRGFRDQ